MYQPLGLECGHRFCADCVFTCVGKGRALGTVKAILDHVPADAACPECRTPGPTLFIVPQHLGSLKEYFLVDVLINADSHNNRGIGTRPYNFGRTCKLCSQVPYLRRSLCSGHPADRNRESHQAEVSTLLPWRC